MNSHADFRLSLGSYLVGALDPATRAQLETHLHDCVDCRNELHNLSVIPGLLSRLDAERLQSNVARAPEGLLDGLLAKARLVEITERHRLRRWRTATATLAVAAAIIGVMIFPSVFGTSPSGPTYQLHAALASPQVTGRVTLVSKPWGTELVLTMNQLPPGATCVAVVTGRRGEVETIGHWGPTPNHAAAVVLATDMASRDLANLTVATATGRMLLVTKLSV